MGGVASFFSDLVNGSQSPEPFASKNVTFEERSRLLADYDKALASATGFTRPVLAARRQAYADSLVVSPTPPPDAGDLAVRKAAGAERVKQAAAGGAGATFLTGPSGLPGLKGLKPRPMAGGY